MNKHPDPKALSLHMDGELAVEKAWQVEEHLAGCEVCAAQFREMQRLRDRVGALADSVEPAEDLWPAIHARLGEQDELAAARERRRGRLGRGAVLAGTIAATFVLGVGIGRMAPGGNRAEPAEIAVAPAPAADVRLASNVEDPVYTSAVADLEAILDEVRDQLQPETVATVEENLDIIDRAIADAEAALVADPASETLYKHLADIRQRKLRLLRSVTTAAAYL